MRRHAATASSKRRARELEIAARQRDEPLDVGHPRDEDRRAIGRGDGLERDEAQLGLGLLAAVQPGEPLGAREPRGRAAHQSAGLERVVEELDGAVVVAGAHGDHALVVLGAHRQARYAEALRRAALVRDRGARVVVAARAGEDRRPDRLQVGDEGRQAAGVVEATIGVGERLVVAPERARKTGRVRPHR